MRWLVAAALIVVVGCGDSKSDVTNEVTDCVASKIQERLTGSTLPGNRCED